MRKLRTMTSSSVGFQKSTDYALMYAAHYKLFLIMRYINSWLTLTMTQRLVLEAITPGIHQEYPFRTS